MRKKPSRLQLAALAGSSLLLSLTAVASAHGPYGTLSQRGYQEMQRLAHELDEVASHANDQAQHQQAWIYNNDRAFLRAIARFADRAERFHERMDTYRTQPWQVDDELRRLIRDAREVQIRVRRARYVDEHTVADWNRVVSLLNQMIRVYQADVSSRPWESWDGYGTRYGAPPPPQPDPSLDRGRVPDRSQLAALAHELVERTERMYNYAFAAAGPFQADPQQRAALDAIMHFRDQARVFHERLESGLDASRLAANANHLAEDARQAAARVQQSAISPEIQADWQQAMQLVNQIQAIVAY